MKSHPVRSLSALLQINFASAQISLKRLSPFYPSTYEYSIYKHGRQRNLIWQPKTDRRKKQTDTSRKKHKKALSDAFTGIRDAQPNTALASVSPHGDNLKSY